MSAIAAIEPRTRARAIASTPYDTAWVAAVPSRDERRDSRFPTALNWIAANQLPDGSWGSTVPYLHDRIICTLAALIPLARFGRREQDRIQVRRGERYLWQHAHRLHSEPCELVGFELLLPTLTKMAMDAGVNVPPFMDAFDAERHEKLRLLPPHLIYSPGVTIAHSLEFLGSDVIPLQLLNVSAPNGSIGNSPAATAFLLHYVEDAAAVAYLERCMADDGGSAVSVLEPCETFDALWTAYHKWIGGLPATEVLPDTLRDELIVALKGRGVSLSPSFPIPDADETAVALLLLHEAGVPVEPTALRHFERADYFVSFEYERHPSVGVNIHTLQALVRYPSYPERDGAIAKILRFLRDARQQGSFWMDKWHISPHYATGRAIMALSELGEAEGEPCADLLDAAVEWTLQTQNDDGSWGFYGVPTVEETALAVLALRRVEQSSNAIQDAVRAGNRYLAAHIDDPRPALWIDKCLYYPPRIVDAAVEAALMGYQPSEASMLQKGESNEQ